MGHARALLGLKSVKDIEALRQKIMGQALNVRQTEAHVNQAKLKTGETAKRQAKQDIFIRNLEIELERILGTKIGIAPTKNGGKLTITYYSDDDLERIRKMFTQKNAISSHIFGTLSKFLTSLV